MYCRPVPILIAFFLIAWLCNALSLAAADWIFDGVQIDGFWPLVIGGAVLGIANSIVKPILTLLTLPLVILTLGLSLFAINVLMLALAEWIAPDFSIDGFWTYIGATIVVWLVNYILHGLFGLRQGTRNRPFVAVCRWLAYSGSPVLLEELLLKPKYSLIDQSLHSRMGATTTNGDGFGVGWYGAEDTPAVFHSMEPAWNDRNLHELARHISSPVVFAHIRASTGTAVQQTNCHPFRHGRWLWMHNGAIRDFQRVKRDLRLAIDPDLYAEIEGSTDSETFFYLALTMGLEEDPPKAVQDAVGFIEETGRRHGVEHPIQMTVATTGGENVWAFRYSSEGESRSLFFSTDVRTLKELYPDDARLQGLGDESRLVVSEPLGDLAGAWNEVPESSWGVVQPGQDEIHPFTPAQAR